MIYSIYVFSVSTMQFPHNTSNLFGLIIDMGVSINGGNPKWMVKIMV